MIQLQCLHCFPPVYLCDRPGLQRADELTDFLYAAFISVATNTLDDFNTGIGIDINRVST